MTCSPVPRVPPGASVVGVGIDLVAIDRFAAALRRTPALAQRLFTPAELVTGDGRRRPAGSLAARFAAKEAIAKALGAPRGMQWHDCVVATDTSGAPVIMASGTVAATAETAGVSDWRLSLSHDGGIAAAIVIALG